MSTGSEESDDSALLDIAEALDSGREVDWAAAATSGPRFHRAVVRQLESFARFIAGHQEAYQSLDRAADDAGPQHSPAPPSTWGNLEILGKAGAGAFGEVFRARDPRLDRQVALKLLDPDRLGPAAATSTVIEEGRLLARVNHPNVVTVYGAEHLDGRIGIWMEFIEGQTLDDVLAEQGPLSAEAAMQIGRDVCSGLAALHEAGVLHRDIKARNVMRDDAGRIVLMDLGVSCEVDSQGPVSMCGTPLYAAPEVLLGGELSHQSDIYTVGVLLFYLVTGMYPVSGGTLEEICEAHRAGQRRRLRQLRPELPDTLVRIVEQSTSPNPEQRFVSAAQFEQALVWVLGERSRDGTLSESEQPSIAVLPFTDLSPEEDQGFLCDGLAEELISNLVRLEGLKVAAHTSTLQVVSRGLDVRQIGAQLKVKTVLEGSIRRFDAGLRITARLSQATDGCSFWTETFDVRMRDLIDVQEEIARAIVANLKVEMLDGRAERLVKQYTGDVGAYNQYMQGCYYYMRRYEGGLQKALEFFKQASERDPQYPLPHVGIADCFNILSYFEFLPPHEGFLQAKQAAQRALALDDTLGEAHASLGWSGTFYDRDFAAAERHFRRSIELNPRWGTGRAWYATLLSGLGRFEEAINEARRAIALDPLSPANAGTEGVALYLARRCDEAIACLSRLVAVHPDFPQARTQLAHAYAYDGQHAEAEKHLLEALAVTPDFPYPNHVLGYSYARSGQPEKALKILARLEELSLTRYVAPHNFAMIELALGRKNLALDLLEQACREHDACCFWFKVAQECDAVRDEPRFRALLQKVGHTDAAAARTNEGRP